MPLGEIDHVHALGTSDTNYAHENALKNMLTHMHKWWNTLMLAHESKGEEM